MNYICAHVRIHKNGHTCINKYSTGTPTDFIFDFGAGNTHRRRFGAFLVVRGWEITFGAQTLSLSAEGATGAITIFCAAASSDVHFNRDNERRTHHFLTATCGRIYSLYQGYLIASIHLNLCRFETLCHLNLICVSGVLLYPISLFFAIIVLILFSIVYPSINLFSGILYLGYAINMYWIICSVKLNT